MEAAEAPFTIEFGRTRFLVAQGDIADQGSEALIVPANARGTIPSSGTSSLRTEAGPDVERELMSLAPLALGDAVATSPGGLESRGTRRLIHAVVVAGPGEEAKLPVVLQALGKSLSHAQRERLRTVTIPVLGMGPAVSDESRVTWIESIVNEVVAHVRRNRAALEQITMVSRYQNDLDLIRAALTSARARSWR